MEVTPIGRVISKSALMPNGLIVIFGLFILLESRHLNCAGRGLVPLNLDIPFIDHRALARFQVDFAIKAAMLDNWPSQSVKA